MGSTTTRVLLSFSLVGLVLTAAPPAHTSDEMARAQARVTRGETCLQDTRYDQAEKHFRKAIEMRPQMPTAYLGLGAALVGQRRYEEAARELDIAEQAYIDLAAQQREAGRVAVERMEETRRQVETLESTYNVFHQVPNEFGLPDNVVSMTNVYGRETVPAQLYYLQGVVALRGNRLIDGIEKLERCLEIDPDHALANYNLAVALHSTGRSLEAKNRLDAAVAGGIEAPEGLVAQIEAVVDSMIVADGGEPD
jgi:Tfp pilus assembly protein PilF